MASRVLAQPTRSSILHLPPHLRLSAFQNITIRQFSASTPRKAELADAAIGPPLALLNAFHSLGIPWYAAIPTSALVARGIFVYYTSTKPNNLRREIKTNLSPLVTASASVRARQFQMSAKWRDKVAKSNTNEQKNYLIFERFKSRWLISRKIYGDFKAGTLYFSLWNFGVLLAMSEAIRMKCGGREGLLPFILNAVQSVGRALTSSEESKQAAYTDLATRIEQIRAAHLAAAQQQDIAANQSVDSVAATIGDHEALVEQIGASMKGNMKANNPYFDASLQEGGFSWCSDLTVADPTSVLSVAYLVTSAGSILINPSKKITSWTWKGISKSYNVWQYLGMAVYLAIGYVSLSWPAAITLYVFSSAAIGQIQRRWLKVSMPAKTPIVPCTRPTRVKLRREWDDPK